MMMAGSKRYAGMVICRALDLSSSQRSGTVAIPLSGRGPGSSCGFFMNEQMNIVIVGHVDHGKSTVIGRLLADTDSLPHGKLQQIRELCERTSKPFEYAFLLDALKDEKAQGITIDSARVFFKSANRHYIIIDAPGHIEFLKNMITGASRADAALLVIDAREGVQENSRRHGYMLSMLGIDRVAVLVNKMDLVDYSREVFESIRREYLDFLNSIGMEADSFVPVSGIKGDNIAVSSPQMPWFAGETVLGTLDAFSAKEKDTALPARMPVQDVYKFTRFGDDRRIVAGNLTTGRLGVGDRVIFYPSGKSTTIKTIETFPPPAEGEQKGTPAAGDAVGFTLDEQLYVARGDLMAKAGEVQPKVATRLKVCLFWLGRKSMVKKKEYALRIGTSKVKVNLEQIDRLIDAATLDSNEEAGQIGRHDVAECILRCEQPLAFDLNCDLPETGRFVIIDDYEIRGGGIILEGLADDQSWLRNKVLIRNIKWEKSSLLREERAEHYSQKASLVLVTGTKDSSKKELAKKVEAHLFNQGRFVYYLGIGSVLYGVDADLKTIDSDSRAQNRKEHLRRFAEVAHLFLDAGMILVATAIELTQQDLDLIQTILPNQKILVIWTGDEITSDIAADARIRSGLPLDNGLAKVKALLQENGIVFKG